MEEIKPRRPPSSRPRPASARPAASEESEHPPVEDDGIFDDNETWLFTIQGPMTTDDIAKMGFTNVILLNSDRWRPLDDATEPLKIAAVAAGADIHYSLGLQGEEIDGLVAGERQRLEELLIPAMCGRGDLLIVIQKVGAQADEPGMVMVGRLIDCLEAAYSRASSQGVPDLAGVSVVLEGCPAGTLPVLTVQWDDGTKRTLEVTEV